MATVNRQNETRAKKPSHSSPDEQPSPNPFKEYPTFDVFKGPNFGKKNSIPGRPKVHPSSNRSKSIEKLLYEFENCQKQQLKILHEITHRVYSTQQEGEQNTDTSQRDAADPSLPNNAQQTIGVSRDTREMIQAWNNRQIPPRGPDEAIKGLLLVPGEDRETKELGYAIDNFIKQSSTASKFDFNPNHPCNSLYMILKNYSQHLITSPHNSTSGTWKIIQYRLDDSGWATPQNENDLIYDSTQDGLICGRIIHDFIEYRHFTVLRICQIIRLFVSFAAQLQEQGELSMHVMRFVLGFAMQWKVLKWHNVSANGFSTLQFHLRFFEIPLDGQKWGIESFKWETERPRPEPETLLREIGYIPFPRKTRTMIAERRASVFMAYGRHMDTPYWTILNLSGQNALHPGDKVTGETEQYVLDEISHFKVWHDLLGMELHNCRLAWQKILSELELGIGLKIHELCDPQTLGELMFDRNDSKRSKFYFVSSFMLQRFADCIEETLKDLEQCCQEINGKLEKDNISAEGKIEIQEISRKFLETHTGNFQDLLRKIRRELDMITPLRENLFNATSIQEASEATHNGRYIFVFTMMTIVYLPLGFVTSLFGMNNITENSPMATSMAPFAVTSSVVAAVTYIIASGSFPFANRTKISVIFAQIWNPFRRLMEKMKQRQREQQWKRQEQRSLRRRQQQQQQQQMQEQEQSVREFELRECTPWEWQERGRPDPPSKPPVLKRFLSFFQRTYYQAHAMIAAKLTSPTFSAYGSKQKCLKQG